MVYDVAFFCSVCWGTEVSACWSVSYHVVINVWSFLINSCSEFSRTLNEMMEPQARMQPCLKSVFIWLNTKVPPHVCLASNVISAPPPPKKIKPMFMQVLLLDQRLFRFFSFENASLFFPPLTKFCLGKYIYIFMVCPTCGCILVFMFMGEKRKIIFVKCWTTNLHFKQMQLWPG